MQIDDIKVCLYQLGKLMYGFNFEAVFGIELFTNCYSYNELKSTFKNSFPDSRIEDVQLVGFDQPSFWEELNYCLSYRGDKSSGSFLPDTNEKEINGKQQIFTEYLHKFITNDSKIYSYPDIEGIPGYPVFWDFRFLIFNKSGECLFVYGSLSD